MNTANIRITGLPEIVDLVINSLRMIFDVQEVSAAVPRRGDTKFVMRYLTVQEMTMNDPDLNKTCQQSVKPVTPPPALPLAEPIQLADLEDYCRRHNLRDARVVITNDGLALVGDDQLTSE